VLAGVYELKKYARAGQERNDPSLFGFENTSNLVTSGIFRYIRHPMYSSLLILAWGIAMKNPHLHALIIAGLTSVLLYLTVIMEEKEDIAYFGEDYRAYMKRSKRFIPWIF
jgi:protein-S-isoprenylcysteine O-methyltransferase Ste14